MTWKMHVININLTVKYGALSYVLIRFLWGIKARLCGIFSAHSTDPRNLRNWISSPRRVPCQSRLGRASVFRLEIKHGGRKQKRRPKDMIFSIILFKIYLFYILAAIPKCSGCKEPILDRFILKVSLYNNLFCSQFSKIKHNT